MSPAGHWGDTNIAVPTQRNDPVYAYSSFEPLQPDLMCVFSSFTTDTIVTTDLLESICSLVRSISCTRSTFLLQAVLCIDKKQ